MSDIDEQWIDVEAAARRLTYRPEGRLEQFRSLSPIQRSAVFNILSPGLRQDILAELSFNEAVELLDYLDPRRVHQVLARLKDKKRRERLLGRIRSDRFEKIEYFLQFHPGATISLLHTNYVYLPEDTTISETGTVIEDHLHSTGKIPVVLVSHDGELIGEALLSLLVKSRASSKLHGHIQPVKTIRYNAKPEDVMSLFISSPHEKVVLMDHDDSVLGFVYSDDVIDLMETQPAVSLYNFAGVESSERPFDSVWNKVRGRYRWLIINLFTCFLAAGVVSIFDDAIDKFVVLAVLMPIVGGMGGNAATQTLAVMVRGIAVGEIDLKNSRPAIVNEVLAGIINGVITGAVLIPVAMILGISFWISLLGALTVVFGLALAGFCGSITPLILKRLGKDPATSAGILISTANDVLVYLFLLGIASLFLF